MTVHLEKMFGDIYHVSLKAIEQAKRAGSPCTFDFNGVRITAHPQSYADDLVTIYSLASEMDREIDRAVRGHGR